jgi:hypothetical protein
MLRRPCSFFLLSSHHLTISLASKLLLARGVLPVNWLADVVNYSVMQVVKTVFFMGVLLFLVLMGLDNRGMVNFQLSPVLRQEIRQPAALMYFGFFAVGVITGTLAAVGQKKPSAGKSNKPA